MGLWIALGAVAVVVVLIVVVLLVLARRRSKGKLTSLVLLLKEHRPIDAQAVRRAATKAFGVRMGSSMEEENFVVQLSPETMPVKINSLPLGFICSPKRYTEDATSEEELGGLDVRIQKALIDHKAWISCDLITDCPASLKPEVYRHIARLLAEFLDDNVLGVFCPENDLLMYNHPGLKQELRGQNPLEALEMKDVPVVAGGYDEAALQQTIEEARRRWPEFVRAFARRKPGQTFGVKTTFTEGEDCEYMWIGVESIDGDRVRGKLDNAPLKVTNVKAGDAVTIKPADVLDWMYEESGEMRGGFSLKVLAGEG
jgi:uncharacterized protein YegJ (DUF2314 family)